MEFLFAITLACLLSACISFGVCLAFYNHWKKHCLEQLLALHQVVQNTAALLKQHQEILSKVREILPAQKPDLARPHRITDQSISDMDVEGHKITLIEVNGKNYVRFAKNTSESERLRVLKYLHEEGFMG